MDMIIATPESVLFEGKVECAKFPGAKGTFMVLPRHAPLISSLTHGTLSYSQSGQWTCITIQGGFVEIKKDILSVCVEIENRK